MDKKVLGKSTGGTYSYGVSAPAGRLVFISGQVALDESRKVMSPGNMEAQSRICFKKMEDLLKEAGASLSDVVKITTFVTDMTNFADFVKVRGEVFKGGPYPASSSVKVAGLVTDGLVVEIEAIAVV